MDNNIIETAAPSSRPPSNPSISRLLEAMKRRDAVKTELTKLKSECNTLDEEILSIEAKICDYAQKGLKLAFDRLDCDEKTLHALSKYDKTGIFLYFKKLSELNCSIFYEDCNVYSVSKSVSEDCLVLEYGDSELMFLPSNLFQSANDEKSFADGIIDICKKTSRKLQEGLKTVSFEKHMAV